jgi:MFS family permease
MITITNLLDQAFSAVLLPVWIRDHGYGPTQIGLIFGAFGVTATIGAFAAAAIGHRLPRRATYVISFVVASAPRFVVLALGAPVAAVVAVSAVGGLGAGFINPILGAVAIERIPRHLLGRVGSLMEATAWAGIPFGGVVAGAAIAVAGLAPALVTAGAIYLAATIAPALITRPEDWATADAERPPQSSPDSPAVL